MMVREDLVPAEKLMEGAICCARGDTVVYPLARIQVEVNGTIHTKWRQLFQKHCHCRC